MDDWGFGIWAVPVALSAALCFAAAERLESSHSTATRALCDKSPSSFSACRQLDWTGGDGNFSRNASLRDALEAGLVILGPVKS